MLLGALVIATTLVFAVWLYHVVAPGGFGLLLICLVFFFLVHIAWLTLDFWNAIVGFYLLRVSNNILARVSPPLADTRDASAFPERIAVAMTIRNEDANGVFARLDAIKTSLSNTPFEAQFDYFVLSDSSVPLTIDAEMAGCAAFRAKHGEVSRLDLPAAHVE